MPRLFTGIEIPGPQRTALSLLQTGLPDARWSEASDLHVTLRFIGDVSPSMADAVVEALDSRAWTAPRIAFTGLSAFGGAKPRSIHAAVAEDEALMRLAAAQERLMQRLGLPPDGRRFTPHVTLARFRGGASVDAIARWLGSRDLAFVPPFVPVRFALFSARESTGGGPYHAEEVFAFGE